MVIWDMQNQNKLTVHSDYKNGTKRKQVNTRYGPMTINVSQDRNATFEPQIVKKRQKDISKDVVKGKCEIHS